MSQVTKWSFAGLSAATQIHLGAEPHWLLTPMEPMVYDEAERAQQRRDTAGELKANLRFERSGKVDRDQEAELRCLCRPERAYIGMFTLQGAPYSVLACAIGRQGMLATVRGEQVTVSAVSGADLAGALVRALPDHPPAEFPPFSVPWTPATEPAEDFDANPVRVQAANRLTPTQDQHLYVQIMERERLGGGAISFEAQDAMGRKTRASTTLYVLDTDLGRLYQRREPRGSEEVVQFAPAPPNVVISLLTAMENQLQRA